MSMWGDGLGFAIQEVLTIQHMVQVHVAYSLHVQKRGNILTLSHYNIDCAAIHQKASFLVIFVCLLLVWIITSWFYVIFIQTHTSQIYNKVRAMVKSQKYRQNYVHATVIKFIHAL